MKNNLESLKSIFREEFRNQYLRTLETFQANVVLAYRLLENQTEFPKKTISEGHEFTISVEFEKIDDIVKANFRKWIIVAGFDELFKWIKELLIDYIFLKEAILSQNLPTTIEMFKEKKENLYDLHIPGLIDKCKAHIGELSILENFRSYNKARNCLHHGNEILLKKFCTKGKDVLEIKGRRFLLISDNGKETIELGADGKGLENGAIKISAEDFCITKKLNEKIDISYKEFYWMKDLAIFLYAELSTDLFGEDNRPLLSLSMLYRVQDVD
jgi:hypothetical protein